MGRRLISITAPCEPDRPKPAEESDAETTEYLRAHALFKTPLWIKAAHGARLAIRPERIQAGNQALEYRRRVRMAIDLITNSQIHRLFGRDRYP
ncbi:MAG: hypothetical protein M0T78_10820 [Actinomycetota bacterium]|nr:hypothetical protein [Actinomycetota bacterium]